MKTTNAKSETNSKMFGSILALLAALLILTSVSFASVNPKVQLQNFTLSESPVQPGHTMLLTLRMKSLEWDNCAERVAVQISVAYPFSLSGTDTQYVERLCFNDSEEKGTFTFAMPVDNLATSGTYPVQVSTTYEKRFTKLSESNTLNLRVGGAPSFVASVTASDPVDLYPGDAGKITINFQNTGASSVPSARASASTTSPLEIKWAGQTQDLGQIPSRSSAKAVFNIEVPKNLKDGAYPVEVTLDYMGEDRAAGTAHFSFMVPVHAAAEFTSKSPSTLLAGNQQLATVVLTNTGSQDARKLELRLKPIFPFSTDGTVRYVDALAPGQSTNLTYLITVDKEATPGQQLLGLQINYEDPQGKKRSDSADFSMIVGLPSLEDTARGYWYVGVLAVIVLFVVISRRFGKKKE